MLKEIDMQDELKEKERRRRKILGDLFLFFFFLVTNSINTLFIYQTLLPLTHMCRGK